MRDFVHLIFPINGSDFAGKYAVIVIWESQTGELEEHQGGLKKLAQDVQSDSRVALVSINTDPQQSSSDGIRIRPSKMEGPGWVQGYLTTSDMSVYSGFDVHNGPAVVIVGPDGKILVNDAKGADVQGKLKGLMK